MKVFRFILGFCVLLAITSSIFGQTRSQEISDDDGVPVILKHLPEYESVKAQAKFIRDQDELNAAVGSRTVTEAIEFVAGTEAALANYPAGKLLIVEYQTPQAATDGDARILQRLTTKPEQGTIYRKVGNYAVFVFDANDEPAARTLLDKVKYQKSVQWLGTDPYYFNKLERLFTLTATNYLVGAVILVVGGVIGSTFIGLIVGYIYFRISKKKRLAWTAYSDAGGLTRLNLDDLSEPIPQK
ncbi:MAG TPA: hypothetical protein VJL58_04270 [Pyrinomonadaceae bacterium]|nr:hypothetical protein [Pyrinomonadaceae bacterium]